VGLSFASNRTNLQLVLESQADTSKLESLKTAEPGMDDLIER
jgi:hypothetical protein